MNPITALRRWLRREPRRLEPVACNECGNTPIVFGFGEIYHERWHVLCNHCYLALVGAEITSDESRNDAVRLWNELHGEGSDA